MHGPSLLCNIAHARSIPCVRGARRGCHGVSRICSRSRAAGRSSRRDRHGRICNTRWRGCRRLGTSSTGATVFIGADGHPDLTVEPVAHGVRMSTVLDATTASRSFDYVLPEDTEAQQLADGRLELTKPVSHVSPGAAQDVSVVVGYIEPAWAMDAAGRRVETSYEVGDGILTQHVRTNDRTTYPVVADPQWTLTSGYQFRVRWNRAETATIANGGWAATGVTAVCAAAGTAAGGPAGAAAAGAACLALTGSAVYTAGVARNSRPSRCLELYMTQVPGIPPTWVPWFSTYTGGSCR